MSVNETDDAILFNEVCVYGLDDPACDPSEPLTVDISGPSSMGWSETGTWEAEANGGEPSAWDEYTFDWFAMGPSDSDWTLICSEVTDNPSSCTHAFWEVGDGAIKVEVTDTASEMAEDVQVVTLHCELNCGGGDPECSMSPCEDVMGTAGICDEDGTCQTDDGDQCLQPPCPGEDEP